MIEWNDAVDLLKLAAVYDQRTVAEVDVKGWLLVGQSGRWTPKAAQRAIVEHYSAGADRPRITPAAITDAIRAARRQAASSFPDPPIPDGMGGAEYVRWYRELMSEHVDRLMADWAAGKPLPPGIERPDERPELDGARQIESRHPGFLARFGRMDNPSRSERR